MMASKKSSSRDSASLIYFFGSMSLRLIYAVFDDMSTFFGVFLMHFSQFADNLKNKIVISIDYLAFLLLAHFDPNFLKMLSSLNHLIHEQVPVSHSGDGRVPILKLYFTISISCLQNTSNSPSALDILTAELIYYSHRDQPLT